MHQSFNFKNALARGEPWTPSSISAGVGSAKVRISHFELLSTPTSLDIGGYKITVCKYSWFVNINLIINAIH